MSDRRRIEQLFEAAVELPREARSAYLDDACGDDEALRAGVEALLRAHERDGVLDRPARGSAASLLGEALEGAGRRSARTGPGAAAGTAGADPRDRRIGPYRVLEEIGRGGMGVVYLAERDDGQFRRRVAIKVIRADGDDDLPTRLVAERQILASLDHPAIAAMLDGGVTEDGRPYLVMEYVAGLPVDVYCDRMRLSLEERLRLFLTVARAVEHAHQNLVVHRDLKPSNILVTPDGRVKLLDFGIAKLLNPGLAGGVVPETLSGRRALTPEYASPEQLRGDPLTTASDVYSLGVVLYRLLTGTLPHEVRGASVPAAWTTALEEDAERPSERVSRSSGAGSPAEVAARRGTTPERLRRLLRGDLDAVVARALRKEPSRRYASVGELARDLHAHLAGEPVAARRGNRWYRARKLVLRHRTGVAAAAAVAISVLAGAGAATWQARVAERERDRATAALAEAERALAQSNEVTDFLMRLFRAGDPAAGGGEVTALELLRRGTERADALADQPAVQARLLDVVGQMYHSLGRYGEAELLLSRAVEVHRRALGPDHLDLAESLVHLARVVRGRPDGERAERMVEEALSIRRAALPADHPLVAEALHELGWLRFGAEQERLYREALAAYRASGTELRRQAELMHGLSTNLRRQGRLEEAVAMDREALAFTRRQLGPDHPATAYAMIHLADHVRDIEGDQQEAERLYRAGLRLQEARDGPTSLSLVHGLHSLAELHARRGEHREAERLVRRALEIRLAATGPEHPSVAGEKGLLALHLARQGRSGEAERLAREAIDHYERVFGSAHPSYIAAVGGLGHVKAALGDRAAAIELFRRAVELRIAAGQEGIPLAEDYRRLGRALTEARRFEEAEAELQRSLSLMELAYGGGEPERVGPAVGGEEGDAGPGEGGEPGEHPNVSETRRALHELYVRWGKPEEAARHEVPPGTFVSY